MRVRLAAALGVAVVLAAAAFGIYYVSSPTPGVSSPRPEAPPGRLPFARASEAKPVPDLQFLDGGGQARSLNDFRGKLVLLNIWATWCAPCREEMPSLDRLQASLGGSGFEVVALSIDQQGPAVVRRFFDENGIKALQLYIDPSAQAAYTLAAVGVPTTLLIDRAGREIGRHTGPAKWDATQIVQGLRRMIEEAAN